jgi:hypothetical protein
MLRDQLAALASKFEGVEGVFQGRVTAIAEALQEEYDNAHKDMQDAVAQAAAVQADAERDAAAAQAEVGTSNLGGGVRGVRVWSGGEGCGWGGGLRAVRGRWCGWGGGKRESAVDLWWQWWVVPTACTGWSVCAPLVHLCMCSAHLLRLP